MVLATYNFASFLWDVLVIFAFVIWFWLLFTVFGDLFSRHDIGGGAKTGWIVFVIIVPFLGAFIYLIADRDGHGRAGVPRGHRPRRRRWTTTCVGRLVGLGRIEIAKGKELLDSRRDHPGGVRPAQGQGACDVTKANEKSPATPGLSSRPDVSGVIPEHSYGVRLVKRAGLFRPRGWRGSGSAGGAHRLSSTSVSRLICAGWCRMTV